MHRHKVGRHIQHYLPLVAIFIMGFLGFLFFPYDKPFQMAVVIAVSCGYVAWGLVHHFIHGNLEPYVVAEYASMALLGMIIMISLLYF